MQQRVRKPHRGKFLRPPGNSPSRWHLTRGTYSVQGYYTRKRAESKYLTKNNLKDRAIMAKMGCLILSIYVIVYL